VAAVHAAGLRWFHTDAGSERSFTRKAARAVTRLGLVPFQLASFLCVKKLQKNGETVKVR
jgi:hypothetical protein